ncbi:hypothetical protein BCF33_0169 [Hasllibacter halocynthiae]|uniref:17 kDa surface antigen n=1 Tax=Hasllibacter halocynthiae TaxID=595589 RepID=A0A2T0X6M4_9RHOB|nr:hypothetical protein [Hasllibacter halocynthiae]PRY94577.1 hypothetical protein BCF33_0169 [Hasllibacter halocynthiae]
MSTTIRTVLAAALCAPLLAACGTNDTERALTGAAGGALAAEVLDENLLTGAAVGGLIGAVSCDVAPNAPNCI